MKIVIDIDNETYGRIQALVNADYFEHDICGYSMQRIANGTPYEERPKGEWIPVSERRFPDDETEVLIQYGQSMMVGYHIFDRTIYPSEFEDENETGWYDSKDNFICGSDEVIAWMPLPEAYKEAENEDSN
jgi:hypothetical protein